ncbi:MAG: 2-aminoadipate transaminase [Synergistaceae bacterium]|nr:2-aminoadipate transaminase [Synergistaceae bacterium]
MDTKGQVVVLGTFSKIFCPGLRVAWICGEPAFLESFCNLKQAADLHTSTLSQYEIDAYLSEYDIEEHIRTLFPQCKDAYSLRGLPGFALSGLNPQVFQAAGASPGNVWAGGGADCRP